MHEAVETRAKEAEATPLATTLEAVLEEYVQHVASVGRAIKLVYAISKYDGILALKEFMESLVDGEINVKVEKSKAGNFVAKILTKDLENLVVRIVALTTANPVLEPVLAKYTVSDEICYMIEDISGENINKLKPDVEGKAKVLSIAKYIIASCNAVLK